MTQPAPRSLRLHIGLFGRRNVGKSSLLNAFTRQQVSIVSAYAGGDRAALEPLLAPETFAAFAGAITTREQAGETQKTEIRAMLESHIEAAMLRGSVADITVRFVSDQVNHTLDREGRVIAGTDAVTEITDVWSFERNLAQPDPAWRLVAARSA